jgi:hypothetical protein
VVLTGGVPRSRRHRSRIRRYLLVAVSVGGVANFNSDQIW